MESFPSAPLINCFKFYWSTFQKPGVKGTSSGGNYYYIESIDSLTFEAISLESGILKSIKYFCKENGIADYRKEVIQSCDEKISILNTTINKLTKEIQNLQTLRTNAIDAIINSTITSVIIVKEIENRVINLDNKTKELLEQKEKYLEEIKEIMATTIGIDQLENNLSTLEASEDIETDRPRLRGWLRGLVDKIVLDNDIKKISIVWKSELTNGRVLLPFKVELVESSRSMSTKINAGLNLEVLKDLTINQRLSSTQIAKQMNVGRTTVSKYQKKYQIENLKTGQNQLRRRGVAYGKKSTRKGIDLKVSSEQKIIQTILKWKSENKTFREMAMLLNETQVPTKTGKGLWQGKTVHQVWVRNKE